MNLQEQISRIHEMMGVISEVRVPRSERKELYKDENIIVIVPLTHRALQKYANQCHWCINSDRLEWEGYHMGHTIIIQRNNKEDVLGITGFPTAEEIYIMTRWDEGAYKFKDVREILNYDFKTDEELEKYFLSITQDINNFATNTVYYDSINGIYDKENNYMSMYGYELNDIPNITQEAINEIDTYMKTR